MLGRTDRGHRATVRRLAGALTVAVVAQWGCTDGSAPDRDVGEGEGGDETAAGSSPMEARLAAVPEAATILGGGSDDQAAAASATFFDHAPVAVVAPEDDLAAQAGAASAAVALGAPVLLSPGDTPDEGASGHDTGTGRATAAASSVAADELERLGPRAVLAFAEPAATWARDLALDVPVVVAPDEPDGLRSFAGLDLGEPEAVGAGGLVGSVAALAPPRPPVLTYRAAPPPAPAPESARRAATGGGDGAEAAEASGSADPSARSDEELPAVRPVDRADDVLVLAERGDAGIAAVATAKASGARVVAVAGTDPRADPAAIAALAAAPLPARVVALGDGFGPAERLRARLEVAATGVELPGGGQVLFPFRRMVALYGHPGAPVLGVLGEQPVDAAVARAQQMAAGYHGLRPEPVVPAFEIITTVASSSPGPDGNYSAESEVADLRPWVEAAGRAGIYVVLDLQPGHTDFLTQARRYEELLAQPHVGLALDPEWRLAPGQRHMAQIGSVGVDEVNAVAAWLAELTRTRRLPQKLLLLHQFQLRMISDRSRLDTGHDELAVLVHADGFGTAGQKIDTWNALRSEPVANAWWGWKNFIDEDRPTFTPAQTYALDPAPWFVSYQ